MKNFFLILFCLQLISYITLAQGEIDDEGKIFIRNERTLAILLNSNGWGGNFRYGKRLDAYRKRIYEIDFVGIKHPKEIKIRNSNYIIENQKRYVFGKLNSFFNIRAGIGSQKEIISKFDKGGIAIRYFYSLGTSLGILKPVYYEIIDSTVRIGDEYRMYIGITKFSSSIHSAGDIYGKASFFEGIDETTFVPGLFVKFGFSFEYSKTDEIIRAIEAGAVLDAFAKKILIMDTEENNQFFISLFISYRFGKIIRGKLHTKGL